MLKTPLVTPGSQMASWLMVSIPPKPLYNLVPQLMRTTLSHPGRCLPHQSPRLWSPYCTLHIHPSVVPLLLLSLVLVNHLLLPPLEHYSLPHPLPFEKANSMALPRLGAAHDPRLNKYIIHWHGHRCASCKKGAWSEEGRSCGLCGGRASCGRGGGADSPIGYDREHEEASAQVAREAAALELKNKSATMAVSAGASSADVD